MVAFTGLEAKRFGFPKILIGNWLFVKESRVCVGYADHKALYGYANLMGKAAVIDDKVLLKKMKRDYFLIPDQKI